MKIVVGSDHAGFPMKAEILAFLKEKGHEVLDVGSFDPNPVDFPDIARQVAAAVTSGKAGVGFAFRLLAVTKALERIADYAKNAAKRSIVLSQGTAPGSAVAGIDRLGRLVRSALKETLAIIRGPRDGHGAH